MKKLLLFSLVLALTLTLCFGVALADKPADGTTGNGSPKAKLLGKLNIIGVSNPKPGTGLRKRSARNGARSKSGCG